MADILRVAVTGAAGQVAYAMLARLASGEVFGANQKIILQLLEITPAMGALEGVAMELDDCSFPLLQDIVITDDANVGFKDCNWALLVGSRPRGKGMERKDLIKINGPIFVDQGKAIAANAASDARVLVVGNPCNTNCLVAYNNGKDLPRDRWSALTRLDHNRARTSLAKKAGVENSDVTCMTIWGNHSASQYPDFTNTKIQGKPATEVVNDRAWLENDFVKMIQQRGAAVIQARGASSAMSAANGAIDHVKSMLNPTAENDWVSAALVSEGQYGVPEGIVFGYPCTSDGSGQYKVVDGVELDDFGKDRFQKTLQELEEERDAVKDLLPS